MAKNGFWFWNSAAEMIVSDKNRITEHWKYTETKQNNVLNE